MTALSTADRRRLWREAASLARGRLGRARGAKVGVALSWALLVAFGAATLAARYGESGPPSLSGFAPSAARFAAWLAAGPIALSAAGGRERSDRQDGVDALASSFGIGAGALRAGRLGGVVLACARVVAVPSVFVALLAAALAGSMADAASSLVAAPILLGFALVTGGVLGVLSLVAERLSPERGARALVLLVVVPWIAADLAGWDGASIPAALDALLTTALSATGAGGCVSAASAPPAAPARSGGIVLLLRNVVGADGAGVRGAPRGTVVDLSLALGRGLHAVLGAPEDGTLALGDLLAGRTAPSRGTLQIDGRSPARDASVRKQIAHLAHAPDLPDARDVERSLEVARLARGDGDPRGMLERLGAKQLLPRRIATLTHGEARAVDAAIALSTPRPLLVVVHEPFSDLGPASATAVEGALRELEAAGAAVVVITSSPRDAARLADDVLVLDRGRLVRGASAGGDDLLDPPHWPHGRPRRMELIAHVAGGGHDSPRSGEPVRAIARRLAESGACASVSWEEPPDGRRGPATLRIAGPDESACALALLDAAEAEGAAIVGLSPVPATLVEVRMATEQLRIAATWHARMQAMTTQNALQLAPPPAPPPDAAEAAPAEALAEVERESDGVQAIVTPVPAPDEASDGARPEAPVPGNDEEKPR